MFIDVQNWFKTGSNQLTPRLGTLTFDGNLILQMVPRGLFTTFVDLLPALNIQFFQYGICLRCFQIQSPLVRGY